MATFPLPDEQEAIDLTVLGQRVTDDLSLYYLPGEAVDFVVEGSNAYLVQFENPAVFGTSFATLNMGNNIFVPLNGDRTRAYIYSQATLARSLPGNNVSTTPIVIPPKPHPKRIQTTK